MSSNQLEMNELEEIEHKRELRKIEGTTNNIEINDRTIKVYKEEFEKKGLVITKETEYPSEDFYLIASQKNFDSHVDPSQGIRKVIQSMTRQPVTIFKNGKPEVKDALYYRGYYYGIDRRGDEIGAEFFEGSYKSPKLLFVKSNTGKTNLDFDENNVRRGTWNVVGSKVEHYIYLPEDQKARRKILEDIVSKAPGTFAGNLSLQEPKLKPKQEKSTTELLEEAKKLLGNSTTQTPNQQQQTKREKELEQSTKKWEQYYKDNQGKINRDFPKTIFDI